MLPAARTRCRHRYNNGWETKSWAYYCGGDHPHFDDGFNRFAYDNTCFTVSETTSENNNFDADITNWCIGTQSIVVVLACFPDDSD